MDTELEQIVAGYQRFCFEGEDDDNALAGFLALGQLVSESPEQAWQAIVLLLRDAETQSQVAIIGAGPLEDLLVRHPSDALPRLLVAIAADESFRRAAAVVSKSAVSPAVAQALAAA